MTSGKSRKAHSFMTWQGMASWSARFPANGNLPYDQRVGVFAPVRRLTPHAYQRVAARCGRERILEPLATPGGGMAEVPNMNSRQVDFAGQSFPRELDWAAAAGSHRRTPRRAPFRTQLHRLSGTDPHQSDGA